MFITFEGPDGSGKTTQIRRLSAWLTLRGLNVLATREPGGTRIGDAVRAILLDHVNTELVDRAEVLLFSAARAQLVEQVIRPHLAKGGIVLSDRFADSTFAYQGYGRGLALDDLRRITIFATADIWPDLTIYLDLPVEEGLLRKQSGAMVEWNRMEEEAVAYHQRVRDGYLKLAEREPGRWLVLDGRQSVAYIEQQIRRRVASALGLAVAGVADSGVN